MNILMIDSATDSEIVIAATPTNGKSILKRDSLSHAITLFDSIHECLSALQLTIHDIELIGVGIGPGSFTGIRIAVSTARMIAQILKLPLVGIVSQELYAYSLLDDAIQYILVAFDAKKGRVFGALYRVISGTSDISVIVPPGDYTIDLLISKINTSPLTICSGDGIALYYNRIKEALPHHRVIDTISPKPERIRALLLEKFSKSPDLYKNYMNTVPFYSRKSDAEIMREKTLGGTKD